MAGLKSPEERTRYGCGALLCAALAGVSAVAGVGAILDRRAVVASGRYGGRTELIGESAVGYGVIELLFALTMALLAFVLFRLARD
jgi:hypothetical protein